MVSGVPRTIQQRPTWRCRWVPPCQRQLARSEMKCSWANVVMVAVRQFTMRARTLSRSKAVRSSPSTPRRACWRGSYHTSLTQTFCEFRTRDCFLGSQQTDGSQQIRGVRSWAALGVRARVRARARTNTHTHTHVHTYRHTNPHPDPHRSP